MIILKTTDFTGIYALASTPDDLTLLQAYIDKYEKAFLYSLFGETMAAAFIADLDANGVPQTAKYQTIYNVIDATDGSDSPRHSNGIKEILKAKVFLEYISAKQTFQGQNGTSSSNVDVASKLTFQNAIRTGEKLWNENLASIETIYWYCEENADTYPDLIRFAFRPRYSGLL